MKRLVLALLASGVVVGGVWLIKKSNFDSTIGTESTSTTSLLANEGKSLKCVREDKNLSATAVSYITDRFVRSDAVWREDRHSVIIDIANMKMHSWGKTAQRSYGNIVDVSEILLRDTISGIIAHTTSEPNCTPWKEDASVFVPPADVSFVDARETQKLLKQSWE